MNLNVISTHGIEVDFVTARCNRAKLDTGTLCNYNCEFCYYKDRLNITTPLSVIKDRVDYLHQYGITEVDLSGGESSVHKDWFELLDYCNQKFEHISCLSNGYKFADETFLKKSKEHGLKEILFSLHGFNEQVHDQITDRKGSYVKILQAIDNAKKHGIVVRINCTVYQKNCEGLEEYSKLLLSIKPLEINFLTLNYWEDNRGFEQADYLSLTTHIKKCIDIIKNDIEIINVRYTPYCYMVGYEKYVCNQYQHIYDRYDWNKEMYSGRLDVTRPYTEHEKILIAHDVAAKDRSIDYKKPNSCITCKFYYICDGIEKNINVPVYPVSGEKIRQVNYYRPGLYDQSTRSEL